MRRKILKKKYLLTQQIVTAFIVIVVATGEHICSYLTWSPYDFSQTLWSKISRLKFKRLNLTSCQEDSLQSVAKSPNETKNIKEKVSSNTAIHIFYGYPMERREPFNFPIRMFVGMVNTRGTMLVSPVSSNTFHYTFFSLFRRRAHEA